MLAVEIAILILDKDNIVLSDLGLDLSFWVSLDKAIDLWKIPGHSINILASESFVIGHSPPEGLSFKFGKLTIWPEYLAVKVVEVSDYNSSL